MWKSVAHKHSNLLTSSLLLRLHPRHHHHRAFSPFSRSHSVFSSLPAADSHSSPMTSHSSFPVTAHNINPKVGLCCPFSSILFDGLLIYLFLVIKLQAWIQNCVMASLAMYDFDVMFMFLHGADVNFFFSWLLIRFKV